MQGGERPVRWESTRVDVFQDEGRFRVVRLVNVRTGRKVESREVTPEAYEGERDGDFRDALAVVRAVSPAGEMARFRLYRRDKRRARRMVNMYRVEVPPVR